MACCDKAIVLIRGNINLCGLIFQKGCVARVALLLHGAISLLTRMVLVHIIIRFRNWSQMFGGRELQSKEERSPLKNSPCFFFLQKSITLCNKFEFGHSSTLPGFSVQYLMKSAYLAIGRRSWVELHHSLLQAKIFFVHFFIWTSFHLEPFHSISIHICLNW